MSWQSWFEKKIYSETANSPLHHRYYCKENTARSSVGRCCDIYGKEANWNSGVNWRVNWRRQQQCLRQLRPRPLALKSRTRTRSRSRIWRSLLRRGDWNTKTKSEENSNFHQLLKLRAQENPEIIEWLRKRAWEIHIIRDSEWASRGNGSWHGAANICKHSECDVFHDHGWRNRCF